MTQNRLRMLEADRAFREAVRAAMGAGKVLTGRELPEADARLITMFALTAYANAGGLTDPSIGTLMRFAPDVQPFADAWPAVTTQHTLED